MPKIWFTFLSLYSISKRLWPSTWDNFSGSPGMYWLWSWWLMSYKIWKVNGMMTFLKKLTPILSHCVDTIFIAYYYYINYWYDKWCCGKNGSSLHLNGIAWNLTHIFSQKLPPNSWFMKNMYALCQSCIIENLFNNEKGHPKLFSTNHF